MQMDDELASQSVSGIASPMKPVHDIQILTSLEQPMDLPMSLMQAQDEDMPTTFEEYYEVKMLYKILRQEWKNLEMFPQQISDEAREQKLQEKKIIKRLLKTTEKANPHWKAEMELIRKQLPSSLLVGRQ